MNKNQCSDYAIAGKSGGKNNDGNDIKVADDRAPKMQPSPAAANNA